MLQKHKVMRDAHANRKERRAQILATDDDFDGIKVAHSAAKIADRADKAEILDTQDIEAFEHDFVVNVLGFLEKHPSMPVIASKAAYEALRSKDYQPKLHKQILVGAQAVAVEVVIDRLMTGVEEVIRQLSLIRHEDFPALIDASQIEASDALRARFRAERQAGTRLSGEKPWLFGKGAGIPPMERKRQAEAERLARRAAMAAAVMAAEACSADGASDHVEPDDLIDAAE